MLCTPVNLYLVVCKARRKKKEDAANAKYEDAMKKAKVKIDPCLQISFIIGFQWVT